MSNLPMAATLHECYYYMYLATKHVLSLDYNYIFLIKSKVTYVIYTDPNHPFISLNETQNCAYQPGPSNPNDDIFQCNFTDENFDSLLENGDK